MNDYRTHEEAKHYGSDLNKWIDENCIRQMTVNNIDIIMFKYGKSLRIIESKHVREGEMGKPQEDILKMLAKARVTLDDKDNAVKIEVYEIIGDPPYEKCDIKNMFTEEKAVNVLQNKFKSFLNFEIEFDDL